MSKKYRIKWLRNFDKYDWAVIILCGFHLLANSLWITLDSASPRWDEAGHTLFAIEFSDYLRGESTQRFWKISSYYPPAAHLSAALAMFFFGQTSDVAAIVVSLFFVIALIFLYLFTAELLGRKKIAFLAALLFSFLPTTYSLSRVFLLEIPLVAFVLGALYFIQLSDRMNKLSYALIASVLIALAILTKWTAVIYIFVPLFFYLYGSLNINRRNLSFAVLIIFGIVSPWYLINAGDIFNLSSFTVTAEADDPQTLLSAENLIYYLKMLLNFQLTIPGFITFFAAVVYSFYKRNLKLLRLIATITFVYFVFTLIPNKNIRYTFPILPFVTIAGAWFLYKLIAHNRILGLVLSILLFAYYVLYYGSLSFGVPIDPAVVDYQRAVRLPVFGWVDYINLGSKTSQYLAPKFNVSDWPNSQIVSDAAVYALAEKPNVLVLLDKPNLNVANLKIEAKRQSYKKLRFETPYVVFAFENLTQIKNYASFFSLVLLPENSFGPTGGMRHLRALKQLREYLEDSPEYLHRLRVYVLPDGEKVYLYRLTI